MSIVPMARRATITAQTNRVEGLVILLKMIKCFYFHLGTMEVKQRKDVVKASDWKLP